MKKKILCVYMLISILLAYIFPIISSANYEKYVALGDSIAQGFTMKEGFLEEDCYPQKIREKLNISKDNYKNLAFDEETAKSFYTSIQANNYTRAISEADLITISIGSNEILQIFFEAVSYATGIEIIDRSTFYAEVTEYYNNANLIKKAQLLLKIFEYFTTVDINAKVDENIRVYEEYWKKSLAYIKSVNPDVTIVATEFYNPYYGITLLNFDFGGWVDDIIQRMNKILHTCSKSETEYKIADIYSDFTSTNPRLTYTNTLLLNFNIDPHPNKLGHELISLKILESLSSSSTPLKPKDVSSLIISQIEDQEYTGKAIKPEIVVKDGQTELVKDEDYIIFYTNNVEIGEASVVIVGIGNYTGITSVKFNIKATSSRKDISDCEIYSLDTQLYLGMQLQPTVVIKDGSKVLVKDRDYTLSYSNNLNAGIATITIVGIGNYTGSTQTNFMIVPNTLTLAVVQDIPDQFYTGEEINPDIIVTFVASKLIEDTDYTVSYENNTDIGTATVTVTGKGNFTGTLTKEFNIIEKPQEDTGDSDIGDDNTENDDGDTGDGNEETEILKDISKAVPSRVDAKTYTGKTITPSLSVSLDNEELTLNTDYRVFYSNNIDVGTAIITIVGIGDYSGTLETTFEIEPKCMDDLLAVYLPFQVYTGEPIEPDIFLIDNYELLSNNTDYTVKYINNVNVGIGFIEITGKGNYTGSLKKMFNIIEAQKENNGNNNNDDDNSQTPADPGDNSLYPDVLPNTGISFKFIITILSFAILSIISYRLYKKW